MVGCSPLPSGLMDQMLKGTPIAGVRWKWILAPSGDQAGLELISPSSITAAWALPSAAILKMPQRMVPRRLVSRSQAIVWPSGSR